MRNSKRYSPGPNRPIVVRGVGDPPPPAAIAEPLVRSVLELGKGRHDFFTIDVVGDSGRPFWMISGGDCVPLAMMFETPTHYELSLLDPPDGWGLWMAELYSMACLKSNGLL